METKIEQKQSAEPNGNASTPICWISPFYRHRHYSSNIKNVSFAARFPRDTGFCVCFPGDSDIDENDTIPATVNVIIDHTFRATIQLTVSDIPYTFAIDRWAKEPDGTGLSWRPPERTRFLHLFHRFGSRDIATYGIRIEDADGRSELHEEDPSDLKHLGSTTPLEWDMKFDQEINCVEQGCKDVIACLERISEVYPRSMLEYAAWYCETHANPTTYRKYITELTCRCIVQSNFLLPSAKWRTVEFR